MKKFNLESMTGGWFIGNFEPTLYKSNFEVGVKKYKKGDSELSHYHKTSKEFTVIISGKVRMNDFFLVEGDIIQVDEFEKTDFECIEDTVTVVVKTSSSKGDKYID